MTLVIDVDGVSVTFPLSRPGLQSIKRKIKNVGSKEKEGAPERTVLKDWWLALRNA